MCIFSNSSINNTQPADNSLSCGARRGGGGALVAFAGSSFVFSRVSVLVKIAKRSAAVMRFDKYSHSPRTHAYRRQKHRLSGSERGSSSRDKASVS